jgi:hypothetical protein
MLMAIWVVYLVALPLLTGPASAGAQEADASFHLANNPVYASLVQSAEGELVRLAEPRFADGQTAEQQRTELARAGGARYSVEALLRPSALAPHVLQMDRQRLETRQAIAQRVRVVFMLQGELESFAQEAFLNALLGGNEDAGSNHSQQDVAGRSVKLTDEQLEAAGIRLVPPAAADSPAAGWGQEHYRLIHGELFSRVRFSGVVRSFATRSDDSVLLALRFDERFAAVDGLRSVWQRLERDEAGTLRVAEQGDFLGGGAYIKITRWRDDPQRLVFEAEFLLLEPKAWFGGSNLLGSKLPPAIQAQVREIRRAALRAAQ